MNQTTTHTRGTADRGLAHTCTTAGTQTDNGDVVSFSTFTRWLRERQRATADLLSVTTGDVFQRHLDLMLIFIEAHKAVDLFEREGGAA